MFIKTHLIYDNNRSHIIDQIYYWKSNYDKAMF